MAMHQCARQQARYCIHSHHSYVLHRNRRRSMIARSRREDEKRKRPGGLHETGSRVEASVSRFMEKHMADLMPQEAGDWKDWFWMLLSTFILVYFSACLFMLYDYMYRAAGLVTFSEFMSQ